ncbi:phage tail terminator family protein [Clostridium sp.]|uniref:phage tail terminator family protein n=1 Tax=Clostridium sp. TaxID=1506 RepID=UPI002FDCBA59
MVTIKDVINAINKLLETNFTVKIANKNIREKIIRPSFYVDLEQNDSIQLNSICKQNNLTVRIYYFPTDPNNNRIELLDVQEKLNNLFLKGLSVTEDFYIYLVTDNPLEFVVVDGVLQLKLELYYLQEIEDTSEYEMMEELCVNIKTN